MSMEKMVAVGLSPQFRLQICSQGETQWTLKWGAICEDKNWILALGSRFSTTLIQGKTYFLSFQTAPKIELYDKNVGNWIGNT